jgi:hypothetical protein
MVYVAIGAIDLIIAVVVIAFLFGARAREEAHRQH